MNKFLTKLDRYILKKFLGTFATSILLIMFIVIVFDISEKLEDFKLPTYREIFVDYYLNFIPYFVNKFSPLFVFISVIFFTSRMASRTEIVAILTSGVSFKRFLRPYLIGATLIASLSLFLNHYLIPVANKTRMVFMEKYIDRNYVYSGRNIFREISPGVTLYMQSFDNSENTGTTVTLDELKGQELRKKTYAREIHYDSTTNKWTFTDYWGRDFTKPGRSQVMFKGKSFDTTLNLSPKDFGRAENQKESMTTSELTKFIKAEEDKGSDDLQVYQIEKHNRNASPFATFILTIIGVTVSSRKERGGIGKHHLLGDLCLPLKVGAEIKGERITNLPEYAHYGFRMSGFEC